MRYQQSKVQLEWIMNVDCSLDPHSCKEIKGLTTPVDLITKISSGE